MCKQENSPSWTEDSNFLASLPWQLTVAWGNGAKLSLLALQQVIHQQLSHPCPRLAHPKSREEGQLGKGNTTNLLPLIHAIWEWQPIGLQLYLQNIVYNFYYKVYREKDLILFNSSSALHKLLFWIQLQKTGSSTHKIGLSGWFLQTFVVKETIRWENWNWTHCHATGVFWC